MRKVGACVECEVVESAENLSAPSCREGGFAGVLHFGLDGAAGESKVLKNGHEMLGEATRELTLAGGEKNGEEHALAEAQNEALMTDVQEISVPVTKEAARLGWVADEAKTKALREALGASKDDHPQTSAARPN